VNKTLNAFDWIPPHQQLLMILNNSIGYERLPLYGKFTAKIERCLYCPSDENRNTTFIGNITILVNAKKDFLIVLRDIVQPQSAVAVMVGHHDQLPTLQSLLPEYEQPLFKSYTVMEDIVKLLYKRSGSTTLWNISDSQDCARVDTVLGFLTREDFT
jgi:hypothetical protein